MPILTSDMGQTVSTMLATPIGSTNVEQIFSSVLLLLIGLLVIKVFLGITDRSMARLNLDASLKAFIHSAVRILLLFLLVVILLDSFGVSITSLVAVLSVAGLALSLSLQDLLTNVASGLQILSTKPFAPGDFIEAGGVSGVVAETGMFYTKLRTIDNRLVQVPNKQIVDEKIINYSAEPTRQLDLRITASYDAPVEEVKSTITRALERNPFILAEPSTMVRVFNYGESSIEYVVRGWCNNGDYWPAHFGVLEDIKKAFDDNHIEMTYNHLNVHMIDQKS